MIPEGPTNFNTKLVLPIEGYDLTYVKDCRLANDSTSLATNDQSKARFIVRCLV